MRLNNCIPIPECNDQALYRYTFILLDESYFLFPIHSLPNLSVERKAGNMCRYVFSIISVGSNRRGSDLPTISLVTG